MYINVYPKSLEIDIRVHGDSHLSVAGSYGNLGNVLHDMGKPEEALVHLQKGLEIMLKLLGSEHPDEEVSQGNIGLVPRGMGKYEEALVHGEKGLEVLVAKDYEHQLVPARSRLLE